jgi:hypothetical protein
LLVTVMVWLKTAGANVMVLLPPAALAALTASRRLPAPLSALVSTVKLAGARRDSNISTSNGHLFGACCRIGRFEDDRNRRSNQRNGRGEAMANS